MPPPPDRLAIVDALRGFALFGILVVNLHGFALPLGTDPATAARGPLDHAVVWLVHALFESKFYVLFSFLFGFGLAMQIERARRDAARLSPRYLRRLAGLFVLGALHATLLFAGDILVSYALLGLVLWYLRGWEEWRLESFAVGMLGVACLLGALIGTSFALSPDAANLSPVDEGAVTAPSDAAATATNGAAHAGTASAQPPFTDAFRADLEQRLDDLLLVYQFAPFATWPTALAMFVFGLVAGRSGGLSSPAALLALARLRWPTIVAIAIAGNVVYATFGRGTGHALLSSAAFGVLPIGGPLLALVYARMLWSHVQRHPQALPARALQAAGRLSLTNYLAQSLACSLIFGSYGLHLQGRLGPAALFALACCMFAVQLALSLLWMKLFRLGPAEWLLRLLVYGPRAA